MRKWLKALICIILASTVGIAAYLSTRPVESIITGEVWIDSQWRTETPASFGEFKNGIFNATVSQPSRDFFGASLVQQGDSPHGWWNLTASNPKASLKKEITIYKDRFDLNPSLMLDFIGERTSTIEWFESNQSNRASNVGILLVGDIGQGYYNSDTSKPRALYIDLWLDINPEVKQALNWTGVEDVENDCHSGFPVGNMPEIGKEYHFKFRIDTYIVESLRHWNLEKFTLKMVQCYVEAKASKASIEVKRIIISA